MKSFTLSVLLLVLLALIVSIIPLGAQPSTNLVWDVPTVPLADAPALAWWRWALMALSAALSMLVHIFWPDSGY